MNVDFSRGTVIVPTPSLHDLDALLGAFVHKARVYCFEQIVATYVERSTRLHDARLFGLEPGDPEKAYHDAWCTMTESLPAAARSQQREPSDDFSAEICVRFGPSGRLLALVFAEQDFFFDVWRTMPGVEPYPWWNSSDKPDDVSDDEWSLRRDDWVMSNDLPDTFGHQGFSRTIVGAIDSITPLLYGSLRDKALRAPPLDERALTIARELVVRYDVPDVSSSQTEDIWAAVLRRVNYPRTPEGREAVARRLPDVAARLGATSPFPRER